MVNLINYISSNFKIHCVVNILCFKLNIGNYWGQPISKEIREKIPPNSFTGSVFGVALMALPENETK